MEQSRCREARIGRTLGTHRLRRELQKVEARLHDFKTVKKIGAGVLLLQRGFGSADRKRNAIFGLYADNPDNPPDFNRAKTVI